MIVQKRIAKQMSRSRLLVQRKPNAMIESNLESERMIVYTIYRSELI